MNIKHRPIFNIENVVKMYSEKDGVPVKYVCTSAPNANASYAADIFYRETPHPEFGNHYFGLYYNMVDTRATQHPEVMITNCDSVEKLDFTMIDIKGELHYSQHRHDFYTVDDVSIDGGRAYMRLVGNLSYPVKNLVVRNGNFEEAE